MTRSVIGRYLERYRFRPRGILHVGAHLAEEMNDYLRLRPERIVWVEGDPDVAIRLDQIVRRVESPVQQIAIQALIAETDGAAIDFYRFTNDGGSSSVFRSTELLRARFEGVRETGEVLRLKTSRLSTVLHDHGVRPGDIDVIVLDLQGSELAALRSAPEYIAAASFIETEVSTEPIYSGAPPAGEVEAYIAAAGFDRATEPMWHGSVGHGDIVFKRREVVLKVRWRNVLVRAGRRAWTRSRIMRRLRSHVLPPASGPG